MKLYDEQRYMTAPGSLNRQMAMRRQCGACGKYNAPPRTKAKSWLDTHCFSCSAELV